jgi:hypothetical protein
MNAHDTTIMQLFLYYSYDKTHDDLDTFFDIDMYNDSVLSDYLVVVMSGH